MMKFDFGRLPGSRRRMPRIAIGGILHETNTFAPGETTLDDFLERSLLRGQAVLRAAANSVGAPGGAVAEASGRADLIPLVLASATPGPPVRQSDLDELAGDLLDRLRFAVRQWPGLDGVVLFVHGAMVSSNDADPDGSLLQQVRNVVGSRCPLVVVVDSHANLTARMISAADVLLAYQTYPHVDTVERGREAMNICLELAATDQRPAVHLQRLPLLMPLLAQRTESDSPFWPVVEFAADVRTRQPVLSLSLVPGFPLADVPETGAVVIGYTWNDSVLSQVGELAHEWWSRRADFGQRGVAPGDWSAPTECRPTVLAEISDNPGAGGAGDGTHLLRYLFDHPDGFAAMAAIVDPEVVFRCWEVGVGGRLQAGIGGKRHETSGLPLEANWHIVHLGDGHYVNEGAMAPGAHGYLGRTATLQHGLLSVMLTQHRTQTLDPGVFRSGGIEPERFRWLAVKSSVHYRAGFRAVASRMIDVECAGLSPSDLTSLPYNRLPRPIFPLDQWASVRADDEMEMGDV